MDPALIHNGVIVKTLSKSQRELVKERFKSFNMEIEEMHRTQKTWAIPDPDLRASTMKEIKSVLIVLYTRFYERSEALFL
jgi:exocyst complex protein 7